jgi:IclR family acetate operon transcriptional repressor
MERSAVMNRSVLKALDTLEILAQTENGLSLSELSERTSYPVSTAHRLLATLAERGYVEQDPQTRRYHLGVKILTLQSQSIRGRQMAQRAFPHLNHLKQQVQATVNLGVLSGKDVVYLQTFAPDSFVGLYLPPGTRMPSYSTALGKVLLAHLPQNQLEALLRLLDLKPFTPSTITSKTELRSQLTEIAQKGYAFDDQEFTVGVRCLSAPICDHNGRAVAGTSITAPAEQLTDDRIDEMAELLTRTCRTISWALGCRDDSLAQPPITADGANSGGVT